MIDAICFHLVMFAHRFGGVSKENFIGAYLDRAAERHYYKYGPGRYGNGVDE